MGQRLTNGELTVIRHALSAYKNIKEKDKGLKRNATCADNYERLLVLIDDTVELFDGEIKSVYVNK